ncbi:MAG TPA: DUF4232 domain-containing protein [Mycobacteriales bacterium]
MSPNKLSRRARTRTTSVHSEIAVAGRRRSRTPTAVLVVAMASAVFAAGCSRDPGPAAISAPAVPQASGADSNPASVDHTSTTPHARTSGKDHTEPPRPATPRCHTADLALEVGQADSGMGHTGLNLALVNQSAHRCRIYGYGGVQLLDAAGAAQHTRQERGGPRPELVTLQPGDRAYSALTWIHSPEAPPCSNAAFLQVIPPDETEPIRAPFTYAVCGNGVLSQRAYQHDPT